MMRLPKFAYLVPKTVGEAARMMGEAGPSGQFVAGGTDLYPNMKRRQQTPRTVISVGRLGELRGIEGDGREGLRVGAGVSLTELIEHPVVNRDYPSVARAARLISTLGERLVEARGFYNDDGIDYLRKRPDELLAEIQLPPAAGWRAVYKKLRRRGAFDFPVLGVAARLDVEEGGAVQSARVVLGGIAPAPLEVEAAGAALVRSPPQ